MKLEERATNITKGKAGIIWNWNARHVLLDKFRAFEFVKLLAYVWGPFALFLISLPLFEGNFDEIPMMFYISVLGVGGLGLLFLVTLMLVGHVFSYQFGISDKSVYSRMFIGKLENTAEFMTVLAALIESPGAMGAGMLAKADQYVEISFADMKKVKCYPEDYVIKFKGKWYSKPFYMNCPPQLYDEIAKKVRRGLKEANNEYCTFNSIG